MNQMIDDLKAIPGVIGAYTWHTGSGLQVSNLPALFKADRLNEMARILTRIHIAGQQSFPDLGDTLVCFEEAAALCLQLDQDSFLVMVCDASINMNLLTMSLNLAMEAYHSEATTQQASGTTVGQAPSQEQLKNLQTAGPLAKPLQTMASELFSIMGPMASIVFDEVLLEWATGEPPTPAQLPALLDGLCAELNDQEKARHYRQLIRSRLEDNHE